MPFFRWDSSCGSFYGTYGSQGGKKMEISVHGNLLIDFFGRHQNSCQRFHTKVLACCFVGGALFQKILHPFHPGPSLS